MNTTPTLPSVIKASLFIYQYMQASPLLSYQFLSDLVGADVWLKHENHNPTCAFKVRGGINCLSKMSDEHKNAGVYTASTGNHGQSIAFAARAFAVKATIYVPKVANQGKVDAMRSLGAEVIYFGEDFDVARDGALQASIDNGGVFVGPTDEVLIEGVASYALEIMQDLPDVDVIIVPVGAGSGICGTSIVAKTINPKVKIIGVQSIQAPSQQLSWKKHELIEAQMLTIAEGMATRVPFSNTQKIMHDYVDDFLLVDDADIIKATKTLIETTHNLIEEASAATLAAALQIKNQLQGKKVVLVMTGGNISMQNLANLFGSM